MRKEINFRVIQGTPEEVAIQKAIDAYKILEKERENPKQEFYGDCYIIKKNDNLKKKNWGKM